MRILTMAVYVQQLLLAALILQGDCHPIESPSSPAVCDSSAEQQLARLRFGLRLSQDLLQTLDRVRQLLLSQHDFLHLVSTEQPPATVDLLTADQLLHLYLHLLRTHLQPLRHRLLALVDTPDEILLLRHLLAVGEFQTLQTVRGVCLGTSAPAASATFERYMAQWNYVDAERDRSASRALLRRHLFLGKFESAVKQVRSLFQRAIAETQ